MRYVECVVREELPVYGTCSYVCEWKILREENDENVTADNSVKFVSWDSLISFITYLTIVNLY